MGDLNLFCIMQNGHMNFAMVSTIPEDWIGLHTVFYRQLHFWSCTLVVVRLDNPSACEWRRSEGNSRPRSVNEAIIFDQRSMERKSPSFLFIQGTFVIGCLGSYRYEMYSLLDFLQRSSCKTIRLIRLSYYGGKMAHGAAERSWQIICSKTHGLSHSPPHVAVAVLVIVIIHDECGWVLCGARYCSNFMFMISSSTTQFLVNIWVNACWCSAVFLFFICWRLIFIGNFVNLFPMARPGMKLREFRIGSNETMQIMIGDFFLCHVRSISHWCQLHSSSPYSCWSDSKDVAWWVLGKCIAIFHAQEKPHLMQCRVVSMISSRRIWIQRSSLGRPLRNARRLKMSSRR